ncbi:predicted protein [Naegleria gruberi]|uniref:Predicted protein n=1 Tax=Naegleria gruberi TaxID=5762 RepID=D2VM75_NAEGR|nr:uncharacterized protein NAEGRDRAFT_70036 [Naegleria gruberi]EFC41939.1 predicted protein [Naegleria gruberi]|eukprot:XP_002674683.1 predicted protein [Naegleria gruberi strain NEG-M]
MNFNPYSNPNFVFANKQATTPSRTTPSSVTSPTSKTPVSSSTTITPTVSNSNSSTSTSTTTNTTTTAATPTSETNRRITTIPKLDASEVKNLTQEIEEELSSPKRSTINSNLINNSKPRPRSQSRLVNLDKDSDDDQDEEEEESKNQDQVRTILTVEVTVIKPSNNGWRVVSNSSLLSLYSSERKQALTSEVEIPTEMALWKESQKKKGFDLYLFLKLNENVQFQILKSVNDDSNKEISSSYLVVKYVDKRSEKIQFIGLIFSTVADLQSTYNLLQRCIVSVPTIPVSSAQTPSKSVSSAEELENSSSEKDSLKMAVYKKGLIDHIQNQILYHTKQMCYHELQKEELLKQLQKLENE